MKTSSIPSFPYSLALWRATPGSYRASGEQRPSSSELRRGGKNTEELTEGGNPRFPNLFASNGLRAGGGGRNRWAGFHGDVQPNNLAPNYFFRFSAITALPSVRRERNHYPASTPALSSHHPGTSLHIVAGTSAGNSRASQWTVRLSHKSLSSAPFELVDHGVALFSQPVEGGGSA